jgi:hypothetical protein
VGSDGRDGGEAEGDRSYVGRRLECSMSDIELLFLGYRTNLQMLAYLMLTYWLPLAHNERK